MAENSPFLPNPPKKVSLSPSRRVHVISQYHGRVASESPVACRRCTKIHQGQKRLGKLRGEILVTREQYHHERQVLLQCREESLEAHEELLAAHRSAMATGNTAKDIGAIEYAFQRVQQLYSDICEQADIIRDLESRLRNLEHQLNRKEKKLYESAMALEPDSSFEEETVIPASEVPNVADLLSDDGKDKPPIEVERYYESVGIVSNYKERLQELEDEHAEDLEVRYEVAVEGQTPLPPEPLFLEAYQKDKTAMIGDYLRARQIAQHLRESCLRAGFQLTAFDDDQLPHIDQSRREISDMKYVPELPADWQEQLLAANPTELMGIVTDMGLNERIKAWRRDALSSRSVTIRGDDHPQSEAPAKRISLATSDDLRERGTESLNRLEGKASIRSGLESSASIREPNNQPAAPCREFEGEHGLRKAYSVPALRKPYTA